MIKKGLAVAVILLFIGVALAPTINATQEPIPDLDCDGDLCWVDVIPGETVQGSITVENIGEEGSMLDWEIDSYPDWGTWTFCPEYGTDVLFGEIITIDVEIILPDEIEDDLVGEIKIVNLDNPDDYCVLDIWIPYSIDDATSLEFEFQRIRELVRSIDLRKIIVNPDALVDTLEEISSILEEEDVRNYIEKTSEEDCGCEDDNLPLEWNFTVICEILPYMWYTYSAIIEFFNLPGFFMFEIIAIMGILGRLFNCDWE